MSIGRVHRPPIEHKPDVWAGGFDDHNIRHDDQPDIPVTVRIRSDGTKSDHNGTTGQWTRSHVNVVLDDLPSMWAWPATCAVAK
jgi:hypothetical protein